MIEKKPFRLYSTAERDPSYRIITFRLNEKEQQMIDEARRILQEPKDTTAAKQLMTIGLNVLRSDLGAAIRAPFFKNKRRNDRRGWVEIE